ncbi:MAG: NTP transferase domain-containing protein [Candidatus Poseidonia sp.]|nr:NTP transferase domain-containing protein [Poseidonia sp.]
MSLTALILAGGQSRRMGEDKAMMHGGVGRLQSLVKDVGIERCIVLCGHASRKHLFQGEVLQDPLGLEGLHRLLPWARKSVETAVLLLPCDAFLLDEEALHAFLSHAQTGGVALDEEGRRQPLFALIPEHIELTESPNSVHEWLLPLPSIELSPHGRAFSNFNTRDDLQRLQPRPLDS